MTRSKALTIAASAFILAMGVVGTARAEMVTLLGPVYVTNQTTLEKAGTPTDTGFAFRAPVPGRGVIIVKNGGDSGDTARASSARVELNNVPVAIEKDFNKEVGLLTYDVDLAAMNDLKAVVRSCEKCEIEITVLGEAAPALTAQEALLQEFGRLP